MATLISRWSGENNLNDNIGGLNGTPTSAPYEAYAAGKTGQAFSFDGNWAIKLESPAALTFSGASDISISVWVRPTAYSGDGGSVFFSGGGVNSWYLCANVGSSGKWTFVPRGAAPASTLHSTTAPQLNVWTHLAVTKSGRNYKLYVNGTLENSSTDSADITNWGNITVGALSYSMNYATIGLLDELEVYNGILSQSEINTLAGVVIATKALILDGKIVAIDGKAAQIPS